MLLPKPVRNCFRDLLKQIALSLAFKQFGLKNESKKNIIKKVKYF